MDHIDTTSWEDFEQKLKDLRAKNGTKSSPLLYRGQSNSEWPLKTTLDRSTKDGMTFAGYYNLITGSIGPAAAPCSAARPVRR